MARGASKNKGEKKARLPQECAVETTIHMSKFLKGRVFKRRAPLSIDVVKRAARQIMHTKDVRVDSKLNEFLWSRGIKGVPRRVRVMLKRKISVDDDKKGKLYTLVQLVPLPRGADFKGMLTKVITAQEEN